MNRVVWCIKSVGLVIFKTECFGYLFWDFRTGCFGYLSLFHPVCISICMYIPALTLGQNPGQTFYWFRTFCPTWKNKMYLLPSYVGRQTRICMILWSYWIIVHFWHRPLYPKHRPLFDIHRPLLSSSTFSSSTLPQTSSTLLHFKP